MINPKTPTPPASPRQLTMAFDSMWLRRMSAAERRTAVTTLASLLIEASEQEFEARR